MDVSLGLKWGLNSVGTGNCDVLYNVVALYMYRTLLSDVIITATQQQVTKNARHTKHHL